jgi:hypothetical protein
LDEESGEVLPYFELEAWRREFPMEENAIAALGSGLCEGKSAIAGLGHG